MKLNIERVVEDIEQTGEPWVIGREGKLVAVLVDPYDLADLRHEVERLSTEGGEGE